ncbi:MAG: hypothetical protein RSA27_01350, partial [Oscillospiraceae bacterium]
MKKYRFLFITFVVISLFAIAPCVFAENIKVDCGKFDSVSGYNFAKGQPTISVWEFLPQKTEIKVQYKVKVAEAGTYAIVFQGSDPNVTYCSPYKIQVNGENETQAAGKPLINRVDAIVATYDMGYFPLHQGENTITFLCDTPCVDNGRFSWWLNYFELKYVSDWKIYETTGSEACNVWTKQQPVCFDLKFTRQENEPKNCYFIIKDFWGK